MEVQDRVLVRKVGFQGKHKLADTWEQEPFRVLDIPDSEMPVYHVRREDGIGPVRTLHRNMLLPFHALPVEETVKRSREAPLRRPVTRRIREPRQVSSSSSSSESESSASSTSTRYVIPQRRRLSPRVLRGRPVPPS